MLKKSLIIGIAALLSACSMFNKGQEDKPADIYHFADEITENGLYQDLAVLAHDSLQGRETGTIGEEKAARFLSIRYHDIGLKPVGDDETYFQH